MSNGPENGREKKSPTGDYEVGYCRTPAASKWRPGQSGNPRGPRKRGKQKSQDIFDLLRLELRKEIIATENGQVTSVSLMQVVAKKFMSDLVTGTPAQRLRLFNVLLQLGVLQPGAVENDLPQDAIADLVRRLAAEVGFDPETGAYKDESFRR